MTTVFRPLYPAASVGQSIDFEPFPFLEIVGFRYLDAVDTVPARRERIIRVVNLNK